MIYLFEELDIFSQEQLERGHPLLPPKRREYVLRFKQAADQKQSAVASSGLWNEAGIRNEKNSGFPENRLRKTFFCREKYALF